MCRTFQWRLETSLWKEFLDNISTLPTYFSVTTIEKLPESTNQYSPAGLEEEDESVTGRYLFALRSLQDFLSSDASWQNAISVCVNYLLLLVFTPDV